MELTVNEKTINVVISDGKSNEDIIMFLNQVIDEELEKDEPNCDLIDDCINAIADISENDEMPALRLVVTCNSIKEIVNPKRKAWKQLNVALRVAIIAAIIISSTFTVNAAVKLVTNVDVIGTISQSVSRFLNRNISKGELTTEIFVPVTTTTQTKTTVGASIARPLETTEKHIEEETTQTETSTTSQATIDTTKNVTQPTDPYTKPTKVELTGIRAEFNHFKTAYIYGESLSYDGLKIYACYSDNTEKEVPLDSCAYSKNLDMNKTADYTLSITYKSCTVKANVTVRPDEATRFSDVCSNSEYDYLKTSKGVYITAYKGTSKNIVLDKVDGIDVYAITTKVFANSNIETFSSASVKIIYPSVFENCDTITKCTMPNATSIGDRTFKDCTSLNTILLNEGLTKLGESTFENSGITTLSIPSEITVIPDMLCNNCEKLKNVTLNGKVTTIGQMAFNGCYELTFVKGTGYIKNVEQSAFCDNENMSFDVIPNLENVGASAFSKCESIEFGKIGNSFKSLGANAFEDCKGITEVTITKNIEVVPASCFDGVDLTKLTMENGVKKINMSAFRGFDITELTIPASMEYIGDYALYSTTLRNITIDSKNVEIAEMAFYKSRRTTINVYVNSTAHKFAMDNELRFNLMEEV